MIALLSILGFRLLGEVIFRYDDIRVLLHKLLQPYAWSNWNEILQAEGKQFSSHNNWLVRPRSKRLGLLSMSIGTVPYQFMA